jgi:hypothetical protein
LEGQRRVPFATDFATELFGTGWQTEGRGGTAKRKSASKSILLDIAGYGSGPLQRFCKPLVGGSSPSPGTTTPQQVHRPRTDRGPRANLGAPVRRCQALCRKLGTTVTEIEQVRMAFAARSSPAASSPFATSSRRAKSPSRLSQAQDCSGCLNSPFEISEIPKTLAPHILTVGRRQTLWSVRLLKRVDNFQE